jgi:hypothetical protein
MFDYVTQVRGHAFVTLADISCIRADAPVVESPLRSLILLLWATNAPIGVDYKNNVLFIHL